MTGLYALLPEERLKDLLSTLQAFTGLPIRLIDPDGQTLFSLGEPVRYCALLRTHCFSEAACGALYLRAGQLAASFGEAYVFTCHAELNHIAFPLSHQGTLLSTVLVGPFLMDAPDSTLVSNLLDAHSLTPALVLELCENLNSLPVIAPARVNLLRKLLEYLLTPLFPAERAMLLTTQKKMSQQARVNETIQRFKEEGVPTDHAAYDRIESALLSNVRTGSLNEAKSQLNALIAHMLFAEGGQPDTIRVHAIELTVLLSRAAIDGGARSDSVSAMTGRYLTRLSAAQNVSDLCDILQDALENCMDAMLVEKDQGDLRIRQALRYMSVHYQQPIVLSDVAQAVGLSPGYFSSLFKVTVGLSFRDQLCRFRVEASKRLLLGSDYSLTDIAVATGFADQSHFCKVFRRVVGLPPGRYRSHTGRP